MRTIATTTVIAMLLCTRAGTAPESPQSANSATPVARLWRDPSPVAKRDLRWGSGSAARMPKAPFTFIAEDMGGSQPKVTIADANRVTWDVKFGIEVSSELASNRIVWA